jgi:hypothetical protein
MPETAEVGAQIDHPLEDEPIHVRVRTQHGREVPDLFLWSDRLWSVRKISAYGMCRSDAPDHSSRHVWRVLVAEGRSGPELTCELVQAYPSGHWRLRSIDVARVRSAGVGADR